ncbi:MAG: hypothetical protein M1817_005232 [Caeruleum heppii]|nr:MAG: hypothetical protein M1817_005232 [Caeruleum heppii]
MKILTKEEEQAHYNATLRGGIGGGLAGLLLGAGGVYAASARYPAFRQLTLPLRAFLVTSSGTFAAIISADKYSRAFERSRHPEDQYQDASSKAREAARARESVGKKTLDWLRENRYPIVGASWVASMGVALALVGRNPYLSGSQKLVQARVYAQGLTLAVLVASAAFELGDANKGQGRFETVTVVDPDDPTHQHLIEKRVHHERYAGEDLWRDMVDTEERKMKEREAKIHELEERDRAKGKGKAKGKDHLSKDQHKHEEGEKEAKNGKGDGKADGKEDGKDEKKENEKEKTEKKK